MRSDKYLRKTDRIPYIMQVETQANILLNAFVSENGGEIVVEMRETDGYINATKMCKTGGKCWAHYWCQESTHAYVKELALSKNLQEDSLIISRRGGNHTGTWVHYHIATHLAMWISPKFAVAVVALVEQFLSKQSEILPLSNQLIPVCNPPLKSAGFNTNVLGHQLYFGIPGGSLILEEPIKDGVCIKYGVTKLGKEVRRFREHLNEYNGFILLDSLQCDDPEYVEKQLKDAAFINSRSLYGKVAKKKYRDTELLFVNNQDDYNELIYAVKKLVDECNEYNSNKIILSIEKERTKQEVEKTKQLELTYKLELLKMGKGVCMEDVLFDHADDIGVVPAENNVNVSAPSPVEEMDVSDDENNETNTNSKKRKRMTKYWDVEYRKLKEFCEKYSRFPSQKNKECDNLGDWTCAQKRLFKKGDLCPQKVELLMTIPLFAEWSRQEKPMTKSWDEQFSELAEYCKKYKELPSQTSHTPLGWWVNRQKGHFAKNTLNTERKEKLLHISEFALWANERN